MLRALYRSWEEVDVPEEADLVLITCCAVTLEHEEKAINNIQKLSKRVKEGAQLVVGGCLPKIHKERLEEHFKGISFTSTQSDILDTSLDGHIDIEKINFRYEKSSEFVC